ELVARAAIGPWIPGPWVVGTVAVIYVALLGLIAALYLIPAPTDGRPKAFGATPTIKAVAPEQEQLALIVTGRKSEIAQRLIRDLHRGVTALNGTGMYTGEARDLLLCALTLAQEAGLRAIVEEIDPDAFVILVGARDIRGRGFAPFEPPS